MKHTHVIAYLILFSIFSVGGVWSGRSTGKVINSLVKRAQGQKLAARITKNSTEIPADKTNYPLPGSAQPRQGEQEIPEVNYQVMPGVSTPIRQNNLLLVWVDQLKPQNSILRGVWLIISVKENPNSMLMPIYPSSANQYISTSKSDETLEKYFKLTAENSLDLGFVMALQDQEIWWTDVLILDDIALQALVDFANQTPLSSAKDPGEVGLNILSAQEDPLESLFGQARLAQSLCNLLPQAVRQDSRVIRQFIQQLHEHVSGSVNIRQVPGEWIDQLQKGTGFSCEFPSMAAVMMIP